MRFSGNKPNTATQHGSKSEWVFKYEFCSDSTVDLCLTDLVLDGLSPHPVSTSESETLNKGPSA